MVNTKVFMLEEINTHYGNQGLLKNVYNVIKILKLNHTELMWQGSVLQNACMNTRLEKTIQCGGIKRKNTVHSVVKLFGL